MITEWDMGHIREAVRRSPESRTLDHHTAQDVIQETALRAHRKELKGTMPPVGSEDRRKLLWNLAARSTIDWLRHEKGRTGGPRHDILSQIYSTDMPMTDGKKVFSVLDTLEAEEHAIESRIDLIAALRSMDQNLATCLVLVSAGCTAAEVAEHMSIKPESVNAYASTARRQLRTGRRFTKGGHWRKRKPALRWPLGDAA